MRRCLELSWLSCFVTFVVGCAASPVVDIPFEPAAVEPEPEPEDDDDEAEPDDDPEAEPDDEEDDATSQDTDSSTASASAPLASADAGGATSGDAGSRADAGAASATRDAGAPRPTLLPTLPGGLDLSNLSPARTRACMASTDCTVSCFPLGFVACCRDDHVCGCSWAPGAYCL